ncbi:uncharacterized protein BP5553_08008 [Venustampulla echinocandica]|uniref:Uncharacterized protein n=1 Tax=Venustampulla echinocandica TaxID=2656787 RepID=A0A370TFH1_9HELO|nr:uncharacterized protein BP5553_08008 [Venustampulla echinocandica]RDL33640.1 hypothetical protein BP5553_08008 [Venustampulla echinocandica]
MRLICAREDEDWRVLHGGVFGGAVLRVGVYSIAGVRLGAEAFAIVRLDDYAYTASCVAIPNMRSSVARRGGGRRGTNFKLQASQLRVQTHRTLNSKRGFPSVISIWLQVSGPSPPAHATATAAATATASDGLRRESRFWNRSGSIKPSSAKEIVQPGRIRRLVEGDRQELDVTFVSQCGALCHRRSMRGVPECHSFKRGPLVCLWFVDFGGGGWGGGAVPRQDVFRESKKESQEKQ